MICDHLSEEIRKTKLFCMESAFRMFKSNQPTKNQLFDPSKEISLVNTNVLTKISLCIWLLIFYIFNLQDDYLFSFLNSLCVYSKNIFDDIQLSKMRENYENISKPDKNKKLQIHENFKVNLIAKQFFWNESLFLIFLKNMINISFANRFVRSNFSKIDDNASRIYFKFNIHLFIPEYLVFIIRDKN